MLVAYCPNFATFVLASQSPRGSCLPVLSSIIATAEFCACLAVVAFASGSCISVAVVHELNNMKNNERAIFKDRSGGLCIIT